VIYRQLRIIRLCIQAVARSPSHWKECRTPSGRDGTGRANEPTRPEHDCCLVGRAAPPCNYSATKSVDSDGIGELARIDAISLAGWWSSYIDQSIRAACQAGEPQRLPICTEMCTQFHQITTTKWAQRCRNTLTNWSI